jgi:ABC-type iron transport system FetAB ATPase subunit
VELRVEDVALERGSLRGISLTLRGGELTALAGPSGIGKTSLLRAIVRLDEPAGGRVLVDGTDARELDPRTLRRRVGFVAQAPAMLPGTVRDNLSYALATPPGEPALAEALGATGLAPALLDRDAAALSGGEQARVAVARALTRDPGALLLDEPTASLDPAATAAVERLLRDLAARGLALLVVTHDAAQAERIADRTLRIADHTLQSAHDDTVRP